MRRTGLLAVACALTAGQASAAPAAWTPTGKWVIEFADKQCLASRAFTSGTSGVTVAIIPTPASDAARLWLLLDDPKIKLDDAQISTGGAAIQLKGMTFRGKTKANQGVYAVLLDGPEYARLQSSGAMGIAAKQLQAQFSLTSLDKVQALLKTCNADLLKEWGFPQVEGISSFATPVQPFRDYFSADDYPSEAIKDNAGGDAQVLVTVGVDGRGRNCRVLRSAGHRALDDATCSIAVRRVRYVPGREKEGRTVEAPFIAQLRWIIP